MTTEREQLELAAKECWIEIDHRATLEENADCRGATAMAFGLDGYAARKSCCPH